MYLFIFTGYMAACTIAKYFVGGYAEVIIFFASERQQHCNALKDLCT
jgi:hypothetical protein